MPSAKKSDEAISPYATAASEGVSMTRWRPGSFLATSSRRKVQPEDTGDDQERTDEEPEPASDPARDRARDQADPKGDQDHGEDPRDQYGA
jgi:hypothetical protein